MKYETRNHIITCTLQSNDFTSASLDVYEKFLCIGKLKSILWVATFKSKNLMAKLNLIGI